MLKSRSPISAGVNLGLTAVCLLVAAACGGGGGGSTSSSSSGGTPTPTGTTTSVTTGAAITLYGSCASLQNGGAGFEMGMCYTSSSAGNIAEALFQNRGVAVAQLAPAGTSTIPQYNLSIPSDWSGPITLTDGDTLSGNTITYWQAVFLGGLYAYGLERCLPSSAPCSSPTTTNVVVTQSTSITDISYSLPGTRYVSFGVWGHSPIVGSEYFFGGFSGPAYGSSGATLASLANNATYSGNYVGSAATWAVAQQKTLAAGVYSQSTMAADVVVTVDRGAGTLTGTLSNFRHGTTTTVSDNVTPLTFSATIAKDGTFSGALTTITTVRVKGALYGPSGQQISGQFAGSTGTTDNRIISGAFGANLQ